MTMMHGWPLFITVLPPTFDLNDVEAYIVEVDAIFKRRERFASLVDTTAVAVVPGASVRLRLAEWQNESVELIRRYNVFSATVIKSAVVRGAATALNWLHRPVNEQIVVSTFAEGFAACIDRLRADGHPAPPQLERLAREAPPEAPEDTLPKAARARPPEAPTGTWRGKTRS
jgi:hypothetical protein